jgi:hypothetical protein
MSVFAVPFDLCREEIPPEFVRSGFGDWESPKKVALPLEPDAA